MQKIYTISFYIFYILHYALIAKFLFTPIPSNLSLNPFIVFPSMDLKPLLQMGETCVIEVTFFGY